jgi:hypothetical protein
MVNVADFLGRQISVDDLDLIKGTLQVQLRSIKSDARGRIIGSTISLVGAQENVERLQSTYWRGL